MQLNELINRIKTVDTAQHKKNIDDAQQRLADAALNVQGARYQFAQCLQRISGDLRMIINAPRKTSDTDIIIKPKVDKPFYRRNERY